MGSSSSSEREPAAAESRDNTIEISSWRERRKRERIEDLAAFLGFPADVVQEALTVVAERDPALTRPRPQFRGAA